MQTSSIELTKSYNRLLGSDYYRFWKRTRWSHTFSRRLQSKPPGITRRIGVITTGWNIGSRFTVLVVIQNTQGSIGIGKCGSNIPGINSGAFWNIFRMPIVCISQVGRDNIGAFDGSVVPSDHVESPEFPIVEGALTSPSCELQSLLNGIPVADGLWLACSRLYCRDC